MKTVKVYRGVLFMHGETGYEGSPWAFQDNEFIFDQGQRWSYEGLHILDTGDILEVTDPDGNHIWTGIVNLHYAGGYTWIPLNVNMSEWNDMFKSFPRMNHAKLIKRDDWLTKE